MKVCIVGDDSVLESKEMYLKYAEAISKQFKVTNYTGNDIIMGNPAYLIEADVLIPRINTHDDTTWFSIGFARAAAMPMVPLWNETGAIKLYGFTKDIEMNNRGLVRPEGDSRAWPSSSISDLLLDLEHVSKLDLKKNPRPAKENINFNLPGYLVGDARHLENQMAFRRLENQFLEKEIEMINPGRKLDDYDPDRDFPTKLLGGDKPKPGEKTGIDWCFEAAGIDSSFISSRNKVYDLMGARWEEGVAFFFGKPIFYINQYVFAHQTPFEKYKAGQADPDAKYQFFVLKNNEERWGIKISEGRVPGDIAPEILRLRNEYNAKK